MTHPRKSCEKQKDVQDHVKSLLTKTNDGQDFDIEAKGMVLSDSNAAIGMVQREGLGGRTRHIQVQYLWIQERVAREELLMRKVDTKQNTADLMTKFLSKEDRDRLLKIMHMETVDEKDIKARSIYQVKGSDYWSKVGTGKGSAQDDVESSSRDSEKSEEALSKSLELSKDEFDNVLKDYVVRDGWIRAHDKPRKSLFTPMKVSKGPKDAADIGQFRISMMKEGEKGCKNEKYYVLTDKWRELKDPHGAVKNFTGWTVFSNELDPVRQAVQASSRGGVRERRDICSMSEARPRHLGLMTSPCVGRCRCLLGPGWLARSPPVRAGNIAGPLAGCRPLCGLPERWVPEWWWFYFPRLARRHLWLKKIPNA